VGLAELQELCSQQLTSCAKLDGNSGKSAKLCLMAHVLAESFSKQLCTGIKRMLMEARCDWINCRCLFSLLPRMLVDMCFAAYFLDS
jgi:hypothetical protein